MQDLKIQRIIVYFAAVVILAGISMRFFRITEPDFVFYDEGYYLNWNRPLGEIMTGRELKGEDVTRAFHAYLNRSFASGKTLWFLLVDSRYFWGSFYDLYVSRLLACLLGIATLGLTFLFARKFFDDLKIALLATALLAVLPSHVFYSRIGMQESLSTFLVLAGFYFYLFPSKFGWRTFGAGIMWGGAFFSNYRLIMLPVLMMFAEIYLSFANGRKPDIRKGVWVLLTFAACVILLGSFNKGENSFVIFSWIFHQADMAKESFNWINLFSYPYYLFRLDTALFGLAFFANFYLVTKKAWKPLFPALLVCLQMLVFSFASEKGARYLCAVLPFAAMSAAYVLDRVLESRDARMAKGAMIFLGLMVLFMGHRSLLLAQSRSSYRDSARLLSAAVPGVKYLSTQSYVQNLYAKNTRAVVEPPAGLEAMLSRYQNGYQFLVICPQAFVSMTDDRQRFTPALRGYLGFIYSHFTPERVYEHFSPVLLERFVFDHNENLTRSIRFLSASKERRYGELRVYDLRKIVPPMMKAVVESEEKQ